MIRDTTYREDASRVRDGNRPRAMASFRNTAISRGDLDIIEIADGVLRRIGGRAGNPTAELEARLGIRATTRTLGTVQRLVKAFK